MHLSALITIAEDVNRPCDKYSEIEEPRSFREAWDHPDPFQQEKWHEAIQKEFNDMSKCYVWKKINKP